MRVIKYALAIGTSLLCSVFLFYSTQIASLKSLDINKLKVESDNSTIKSHIEWVKNEKKAIVIKGWLLDTHQQSPAWDTRISALLVNGTHAVKIPTRTYPRNDVISALNTSKYTKNAGFTASVIKRYVASGDYRLHLLLEYNNKAFLIKTNETFTL